MPVEVKNANIQLLSLFGHIFVVCAHRQLVGDCDNVKGYGDVYNYSFFCRHIN